MPTVLAVKILSHKHNYNMYFLLKNHKDVVCVKSDLEDVNDGDNRVKLMAVRVRLGT